MRQNVVLVTGGAGFIGSHLCEGLLNKGYSVVCLDNLSTGKLDNLKDCTNRQGFEFVKADVVKDDLENLFISKKINFVFHHAAIVGVKRTLENPLEVLDDILGIKKILELSLKYKVKKVVFASSSEVYGEPVNIPEVEDGHVNAKLPYAIVKLIGEKYMEIYFKKYGLNTCSLRFFNVYGPRQDSSEYGFVVGIFIKQVLSGKSPSIFGDGTQTRDFVYIKDNVEATIKAMETNKTNGETINIGTGRPVTLLDLAETVITLCRKEKEIEPIFMKNRRQDVIHRFPNVSKMMKLLSFKPYYKLEDGLKKTIQWYIDNNLIKGVKNV
jgi:nucleoside-diphosphate-sugar epimerase